MIDTKLVLSSIALTLIAADGASAYQTQQKSTQSFHQSVLNSAVEVVPSLVEETLIAEIPAAPVLIAVEPPTMANLRDQYGMQFVSMPLIVEYTAPRQNTAPILVNPPRFNGVAQESISKGQAVSKSAVKLSSVSVSSSMMIPASFMERTSIAAEPEVTPGTQTVAAIESKPKKARSIDKSQMQFIDSPLAADHATSQPRFGKNHHRNSIPGVGQVSFLEEMPANCNRGTIDLCTL